METHEFYPSLLVASVECSSVEEELWFQIYVWGENYK